MELRKYRTEDLPQIARLFRDTIRTINTRDYTPPQVEAWSSAWEALQSRDDFFSTLYTLVAVENGQVVGYGNLDGSGYLDHLYVHKDFQGRGIATALCQALEQHARDLGCREVTVHASITARPFFEHRGYRTEEERTEQRLGVSLVNYAMQKDLTPENPGLRIGSLVWGVTNIPQAVSFWCQALGYRPLEEPSEDWAKLGPAQGEGFQLSLKLVSSPRARRHHMDLFAENREAQVERLLALGAKRAEWRYEEGADYTVLTDPDSNPFCVVQK